jgi:hypothetical protein
MKRDVVTGALLDPAERALKASILEGLDLATAVAHEVMMVLAAVLDRLVAIDPRTELDLLHVPLANEQIENAVDGSDPDSTILRSERVQNLLRGETAVLCAEQLDDCTASPTAPQPLGKQAAPRRLSPAVLDCLPSHRQIMVAALIDGSEA